MTITLEPQFRTGDQVRIASDVSLHGFYVSGTVAQLGSIHDGVLEFPQLGSLPVRIRVRATNAEKTHCHFYDLTLAQQGELKKLLQHFQSGGADGLNELSYNEIAKGQGGDPPAANGSLNGQNGNGSHAKNGNGRNGIGKVPLGAVANGNGRSNGNGAVAAAAEPVAAPASSAPANATKKSTGLIATTILIVGIIAIATIVYLFFRNQLTIPVQNSVLLGNFFPVKASTAGVLEEVYVKSGDHVSKGDPLFRIVDQSIAASYVETQAALRTAEVEEGSAQVAVKNAQKQLSVMAHSLKNDMKVAQSSLKLARADAKRTQSIVNRLKGLAEQRKILVTKYDEALMAWDAAKAAVEMSESEISRLKQREEALSDSGVLIVGDSVDQSLPLAESRLAAAQANVAEIKVRMTHLEDQRKGFTITAGDEGSIYAAYLKTGSFVKAGGEVLAITTEEENWAVGHISQKMALKVLPGQKVKVKLPALGLSSSGEVASVGHRGLYSQSGWNPDFRADPTLVPIKVDLPDIPYEIPAGMRIGMVIQLEHHWPWEEKDEPMRTDSPTENATASTLTPAK